MAQDSYANRATWLLSRVINELKANPGKQNLPERYEIWRELQLWLIEAPQCMRPLVEVVAEGENDVATILFASSSAGKIAKPHMEILSRSFTDVLHDQFAGI